MNELHKKQTLGGQQMLQLGKNSFNKGIFDLVAKRQVKQLMLQFVKSTND